MNRGILLWFQKSGYWTLNSIGHELRFTTCGNDVSVNMNANLTRPPLGASETKSTRSRFAVRACVVIILAAAIGTGYRLFHGPGPTPPANGSARPAKPAAASDQGADELKPVVIQPQ